MLNMFNVMPDFTVSDCTVAVLPVGALEQHGSHLPVGTDNIIAGELASRVADRLDAYLLPIIGITSSIEHRKGRGTVYLKAATLSAVIRDIAESLQYSGFKKLIIINGHGGNWIMKPTVRQIIRDFEDRGQDMQVVLVHTSIGSKKIQEIMEHKQHDLHAGEYETSVMYHLCKEHVREIVPQMNPTTVPQDFMDYFDVTEITEDGYWGYPESATEAKGELMMNIMVESALEYLDEIAAVRKRVNGEEE